MPMPMPTNSDISMNEVCETITILYSKLTEVQRSINRFNERFSLSFDHNNTLTTAEKYISKGKISVIQLMFDKYSMPLKDVSNCFSEIIAEVLNFIENVCANGVEINDRELMIDNINKEIQAMENLIDEIDEVTASDKFNIIEKDCRDIETNLLVLATHFKRYKFNDNMKKTLTYMYIDSTLRIVSEAEKHFNDPDGPILKLAISFHESEIELGNEN